MVALQEWEGTVREAQRGGQRQTAGTPGGSWQKYYNIVVQNRDTVLDVISKCPMVPEEYKDALKKGLHLSLETLSFAAKVSTCLCTGNYWDLAGIALQYLQEWLPVALILLRDILPNIAEHAVSLLQKMAAALQNIAKHVLSLFQKLKRYANQVFNSILEYLNKIIKDIGAIIVLTTCLIGTGAVCGAAVGGPVGAVVGGTVGLVLSLAIKPKSKKKQ